MGLPATALLEYCGLARFHYRFKANAAGAHHSIAFVHYTRQRCCLLGLGTIVHSSGIARHESHVMHTAPLSQSDGEADETECDR